MKLKFLYVLGFFLCLSTLASSNECVRHCPVTANPTLSPVKEVRTGEPGAATTEEEEGSAHQFSPIIRLLYI
jgi:hypothetical protein